MIFSEPDYLSLTCVPLDSTAITLQQQRSRKNGKLIRKRHNRRLKANRLSSNNLKAKVQTFYPTQLTRSKSFNTRKRLIHENLKSWNYNCNLNFIFWSKVIIYMKLYKYIYQERVLFKVYRETGYKTLLLVVYKTSLFFEVPKWLSIKPYFFNISTPKWRLIRPYGDFVSGLITSPTFLQVLTGLTYVWIEKWALKKSYSKTVSDKFWKDFS